MSTQCDKYKGNPIYWKSENNLCIVTYDQFAFQKRYKLYLNNRYVDSSDNLASLIDIAKRSYFYKVRKVAKVMEEVKDSIHKTSTGKVFKLTDFEGNPLSYGEYKDNFTRNNLAILEVGQILRSESLGIMLQRVK